MRYEHTQTAPLYLVLILAAVSMFAGAWLTPVAVVQIVLAVTGAVVLVLAFCFRQLTVADEGDRLLVAFGPLPVFRRRVIYREIESVARGRTRFWDGWGIHMSLGGGWTWNLWGRDCVTVRFHDGGKLNIGTDDAAALESFLQQQADHGAD